MDNINIDDDLQKKIESTKFVFMVAQSGVGKTFNGDYLQAIRGWKHIDGDIPMKQADGPNSKFRIAFDQMLADYIKKANQGEEWVDTGAWKVYMKELARLALEGARDSDTVVLTHASYIRQQRTGLRQYLIDAGAKDVSTVFLHCDFDAHIQALWKRTSRQVEEGDTTVEEMFKHFGISGVVDFDSYVKWQKECLMAAYDEPDESEQPYTIVDVTAKDVSVWDSLDEVFGIENTSRGDLTYDEMVQKIQAIDAKRDLVMLENMHLTAIEDSETSEAEKEMAKKEPRKLAARRSILLEADKLHAFRRLSSASMEDATSIRRRRSSFITTGKFEE